MINRLRAAITAFRSSPENPTTSLSDPESWLWNAFGARGHNTSGVVVNERTALTTNAVYACIRIISETVASLPLLTYERLARGKKRADAHPVYSLLHDRPNPEMSAMTFRETMQAHTLAWGNCYAEIEENKAGTVIGLWPLLPDRTYPLRRNGAKVFVTTLPDGTQAVLPNDRVFHVPGLSFDGLCGYSPVQLGKNAIGLTSAAEQFGSSFFGRGASPSGVLEHPKALSDPARANLRASYEAMNSGLSGAHRMMLLEEGMQWKQLGIAPNNAQFLETRKFQVSEIARMFRVPPHMLADLENGASYASVEQMSLDFVTYSLRPWLVRWEQAINNDLFGPRERATYFAEHLVEGLLRGDIKSRYDAYAVGRQWGWLSADDVREMENMNPLPDGQGEKYLSPMNMIPADQVGKLVGGKAPSPDPAAGAAADPKTDPKAAESKSQRDAYCALLRDVGDRMVRREVPQLRKALKQGEAAWSQSVEAVYREQIDAFAKALQPAFDALLSFGPAEVRRLSIASRGLAHDLASTDMAAARAELDRVGFAGAEALLVSWEASRAEAFAERGADFIQSLLTTPTLRVA